ncbi:neurofilament light polypeptide-like [Helianthus annuus]|uniref:neurofilament light polypeptide-like n=1 Tax=Helianthus annuus TaxID=4232 RepID=UPI000B8F3656|nr:neurofilament light polypeptide-like [Helianthus annuus]
MFENVLVKRKYGGDPKCHNGKELKKRTIKKAKETQFQIVVQAETADKMQCIDEEDADGDDVDNEDEVDVDNVDKHADNDHDGVDDDDGFDHDDHFDYAELEPEVKNAMEINDENEEALYRRVVDEDVESQNRMFEVSASGNHALVRVLTQYEDHGAGEKQQNNEAEEAMAEKLVGAYKELEDCYNKMRTLFNQSKIEYPNSLLVHIKYSQRLTLLNNMSTFVDENASEVSDERDEGENKDEVEREGEGEGEHEGEWEIAGDQNAKEVPTFVDENAKEVLDEREECENEDEVEKEAEGEREREGEEEGEGEGEHEGEMAGDQNARPSTVTPNPINDDAQNEDERESEESTGEDINENDIKSWD